MASFWVTFKVVKQSPVCVEAPNAETAQDVAEGFTGAPVAHVMSLPYPASPRINTGVGMVPTFCMTPDRCAGHTTCPRDPSCSE